MLHKFIKPTVPTVPKKEHDALQERYDNLKAEWQTAQDTIRRLTEEKANVQQVNGALAKEVAVLKDAQQAQLEECEQLSAENATLRGIVQEMLNLLLKDVDTRRTGGEPLRRKFHDLVQQAGALGFDIFEVVKKLKEGKESIDGNH